MTYQRFEDLPVWQVAMRLAERVFALTEDRSFAGKGDLRRQLQRAAISVGNNVAEGFERGTTQELLTFLYIARGSAGEVRSMLLLADRLACFGHLKSEISNLKSLAEEVSRQLRGWADSLQNSPITGQRYLNEQTRRRDQHRRRADAYWRKLETDHRQRMQGKPDTLSSLVGAAPACRAVGPKRTRGAAPSL
ncbi:MAG TPA: four helix bundle protein [Phycisphaerae bacterium]|nr:four helix bundle protein [Phycisphaerae bacterium]